MDKRWWWKTEPEGDWRWNKAAFYYELLQRTPKRRKRFKTYVELSGLDRFKLEHEHKLRFGPTSFTVFTLYDVGRDAMEPVVSRLKDEKPNQPWKWYPTLADVTGAKIEKGWSPVEAISWNLNATDKALTKKFRELIHGWRRAAGIESPKKNPKDKPKALPWRVLELIDRQHAGEKLDNDGQYSQVSKWHREAERIVSLFPDRP